MERDEILKKSREENKDRDFVEEAVLARANTIALAVGMIMCGIVSILRGLLTEKVRSPPCGRCISACWLPGCW